MSDFNFKHLDLVVSGVTFLKLELMISNCNFQKLELEISMWFLYSNYTDVTTTTMVNTLLLPKAILF